MTMCERCKELEEKLADLTKYYLEASANAILWGEKLVDMTNSLERVVKALKIFLPLVKKHVPTPEGDGK